MPDATHDQPAPSSPDESPWQPPRPVADAPSMPAPNAAHGLPVPVAGGVAPSAAPVPPAPEVAAGGYPVVVPGAPPPPVGYAGVEVSGAPSAQAAHPSAVPGAAPSGNAPINGAYVAIAAPGRRARRRRGGLLLGLGCVLSAALGAGAVLATRSDRSDAYGLTEAQAATAAARSVQFEMTVTTDGVSMHASGVIDNATRRIQMSVPVEDSVPDLEGSVEVVIDEHFVEYIKAPAGVRGMPEDQLGKWIRIDLAAVMEEAGVDMSTVLQANPLASIGSFDPNEPAEDLGFEELDGIRVRHYRPQIDHEAVRELVPQPDGGDAVSSEVAQLIEAATVDVWVDADNLVRRLTMLSPGTIPFMLDMRLSGFGEPVDIQVPSADQVVEASEAFGN